MTTWSINGIDLGYVTQENIDDVSNIVFLNIPQSAPSSNMGFDVAGPQETLTITGQQTFTSITNAQTFVGTGNTASGGLRSLINGAQNAPYTYVSQLYGSLSVKVGEVQFYFDTGSPYNLVNYTLTLVLAGT
jgi:hypothetical protein